MNRERLVFGDPLAHRYDWILDSTVPADIIATDFLMAPPVSPKVDMLNNTQT